jgi:hypothetical protein
MEIKNFLPQKTNHLKNGELQGLDAWVNERLARPVEYKARAMVRKALLEDNQTTDNTEIQINIGKTWKYVEENRENIFNGLRTTREGVVIIPEKINEEWQIVEEKNGEIKTKVKISASGESELTLNQEKVKIDGSSNYPRAALQVFDLLFTTYQNNRPIEPNLEQVF